MLIMLLKGGCMYSDLAPVVQRVDDKSLRYPLDNFSFQDKLF